MTLTSISQTLPAAGTEEGQLPLSISLLVFYPVPGMGQRTTCLPGQLPDPSSPTWLLLGWQKTLCLGCWVPKQVLQRNVTAGSGIILHQKITDSKIRHAGTSCSQAVRAIPNMVTSPSNPPGDCFGGSWTLFFSNYMAQGCR